MTFIMRFLYINGSVEGQLAQLQMQFVASNCLFWTKRPPTKASKQKFTYLMHVCKLLSLCRRYNIMENVAVTLSRGREEDGVVDDSSTRGRCFKIIFLNKQKCPIISQLLEMVTVSKVNINARHANVSRRAFPRTTCLVFG